MDGFSCGEIFLLKCYFSWAETMLAHSEKRAQPGFIAPGAMEKSLAVPLESR
jgi:hypothetical protein